MFLKLPRHPGVIKYSIITLVTLLTLIANLIDTADPTLTNIFRLLVSGTARLLPPLLAMIITRECFLMVSAPFMPKEASVCREENLPSWAEWSGFGFGIIAAVLVAFNT